MLTYPSDSFPQIVPMDEDVIPSNPFCSAPPHSEPPPPLLPFSSITPSCANDGISTHRRSGRIEGIRAQTSKNQSHTVSEATQKPSRQNPSPSKWQTESEDTVSQSNLPELESTQVCEEHNKEGFDFTFPGEHQKWQKDQKSPWNEPRGSAAESSVERDDDNAPVDASKSDMDTCEGSCGENASGPKGWVIGPFFQSFKSKMASFTEIVLSPAKLFRANSPLSMDHEDELTECNLQDDGTPSVDPRNTSRPLGRCETENQEALANRSRLRDAGGVQSAKTAALKYSKKLVFDDGLPTPCSEQADECAMTWTEKDSANSVPPPGSPSAVSKQVSECIESVIRSSLLWEPSIALSAFPEYLSKKSAPEKQRGMQAVRLKPVPRKHTGQRAGLKKPTVTPVISNVTEKESDPEVGEQLSQGNPVLTSMSDSGDAEKTRSSSLVCYTRLHPANHDDIKNIEGCGLVRQGSWNISHDGAAGRTPTSTAGLGRSKRALGQSCQSQELVTRKKVRADSDTGDPEAGGLIDAVSHGGTSRRPRAPRKEVASTGSVARAGETLRPTASTQAKRKGKVKNEEAFNSQAGSSPDARLVCSLDTSGVPSQKNRTGSSRSDTKPSGSGKRLQTNQPDVNMASMDFETTLAISSTRRAQQEPVLGVPVPPDKTQLHSTGKRRALNKRPLKRKTPVQGASRREPDTTLVSESPALPLELASADVHASRREEGLTAAPSQPSKRTKRGFRGDVRPSGPGGTAPTKLRADKPRLITKETPSLAGTSPSLTDPVYFEMTPFERHPQAVHSPSHSHLACNVRLHDEVEQFTGDESRSPGPVSDDVFPADAEANRHSVATLSAPRVNPNPRPRRADNKRRRCRVFHSRTLEGEEMTNSLPTEDADPAATRSRLSGTAPSRRLLRSYSCPELPTLLVRDAPRVTSGPPPHQGRAPASHQHPPLHPPLVPHVHKFVRRARRHTVCSVEVEREIVPLCLRKEVYPSRRSAPYDGLAGRLSPRPALSPGASLAALVSCFLSSPLAFLSKKVGGSGTSARVSSPSSSSHATSDSSSSGHPLETERRQRCAAEDGEDTSSSSQEYEELVMREEKALSDSEIKVEQKLEERRKVSSIRIRKTLPKPQNNLTPMGLPKLVRLKKKQFSLEEIYTNKNFSKPPESRLETIFEVALNRRNGSEAWFGQRRVKRLLEFPDVGEARKPKKPLVGAAKAGIFCPRTRRGSFTKDEPALSAHDVDSLLCAKLDQLNLWLMQDEEDR